MCTVGNSTAVGIGIITTNSSLSAPEPLTWTIAIQPTKENNTRRAFERDFFLGTPPSLDLRNTSRGACALIFDGVSSNLTFNDHNPQYGANGTCDNALGPACVSDLRSQSVTELQLILGADGVVDEDTSGTCEALASALREHAPASCSAAGSGNWGTLLARPLTGRNVSMPLPSGGACHPTTERDYVLTPIARNRVETASGNVTDVIAAGHGVTPLVTVVWGGEVRATEADMVCLKVVEANGTATGGLESVGVAVKGGVVVTAGVSLLLSLAIFGGLTL